MDHFPSLCSNVICKTLLTVFKNTKFFSNSHSPDFFSSLHAGEGGDLCGKGGKVCAKPADIPLKAY